MGMSMLNLWLAAFEAQSPLSLLAPHQGQLVHKTSLLRELSYGDSSAQRRTHTRVSTKMQNEGGFFVIINYSATKLSVGIAAWKFWDGWPLLQSGRVLLPHSTPADKWWNSRPLQTRTQILVSRTNQFRGSDRFKDLSCGLEKEFPGAGKGSIHFNSLKVVIPVGQVSVPC